jgi:hyperosmotically inducible protein
MLKRTLTAALALSLLGSSAWAGQMERKDLQIFTDISNHVNSYSHFTIFDDVNASVNEGVVTLTGWVTMPYKRSDIQKRVEAIAGVKEVQDRIEVLPVSTFDDELRYRVARAIYTNPTFWTYASMANPPIHIVVEHGHVTLTGVVNSNVERMLARSLATSFGAFSVTNDLKTDEEMKTLLESRTEED